MYVMLRLRESLSGSLSVSSIRHVIGVCLVVVWLFGRVWVFVVCVLLGVVRGCVRCGGLRRLPALKTSFVVCGYFVVVVLLSGFGCLERGASGRVVCVFCSMGRFF